MTDATALRLAKRLIGANVELKKIARWDGRNIYNRCAFVVYDEVVQYEVKKVYGSGPTWEHAFIQAGINP